jgi:hypothetical protein
LTDYSGLIMPAFGTRQAALAFGFPSRNGAKAER